MDKKNDFFLGAPLPLWGCVSIWLGNLVRLTLKVQCRMLGLLCFSHMEL